MKMKIEVSKNIDLVEGKPGGLKMWKSYEALGEVSGLTEKKNQFTLNNWNYFFAVCGECGWLKFPELFFLFCWKFKLKCLISIPCIYLIILPYLL